MLKIPKHKIVIFKNLRNTNPGSEGHGNWTSRTREGEALVCAPAPRKAFCWGGKKPTGTPFESSERWALVSDTLETSSEVLGAWEHTELEVELVCSGQAPRVLVLEVSRPGGARERLL